MSLSLDYTCLVRGGPQGDVGVEHAELERAAGQHGGRLAALLARRTSGGAAFLDLPDDKGGRQRCRAYADSVHGRFENLVVLGIGGSALGTLALHAALSPPLHDHRPRGVRPRLFVLDNVDPALVGGVLQAANPATTLFNVISKSGSTAETMSQFLLFLAALRSAVGERWREHVVVTTDPEEGLLRRFADAHELLSFPVPRGVGGRFSVLSAVGLLPGALMGWDLEALAAGARTGRERCLAEDFWSNPAALLAAGHHLLDTRHGVKTQVLFPYSHRLRRLVDWNVQLVAESLGKVDAQGRAVGPLPHGALGATDQHSQVQLFAQGPKDKVFTFVRVLRHRDDVAVPAPPEELAELAYLGGRSFGELLDAECRGTRLALTEAGCPNALITLPHVDEASLGELLLWLEIATAYGGECYGVDAFDQPGVEAGKIATFALMGHPRHAAESARVLAAKLSDPRYCV